MSNGNHGDNMNQRRINATIFIIANTEAVIDYTEGGEWIGGERVSFRRGSYRIHPGAPNKTEQDRSRLYEMGYSAASFRCANLYSGAVLETYRWAS